MIKTLRISRFKSIKKLSLDCRRINIFIGEPNTGKSNILEALGMFSFLCYSYIPQDPAKRFVRLERTSNLFYDENLDQPIEIKCDGIILKIEFKNASFQGICNDSERNIAIFGGSHGDLSIREHLEGQIDKIAPFKFYRFIVKEVFPRSESNFLLPPSGDNLLSLLLANRELRSTVNLPFSSRGLRLGLRPQEGKIEVVKQWEDVIISYPYSLASETLQRLTFHVAAILSNKKSVLVFEEPEAHAFPSYIKHLAELIALDQNENQYFIATHNPYFLMPLLAKAPKNEVSVNIVYYENHETRAKLLAEKDIQEMMEIDVFSNLERYLEPG